MSKKWNGCWEDKGDRNICRWILVWEFWKNDYLGCIGGYSGGGAFQLEKFIYEEKKCFISCNLDFSKLNEKKIILSEESQDLILTFHQEEMWTDSENLLLSNHINLNLIKENDLFLGGEPIPYFLSNLFDDIGLISKPVNFE